MRENAEQNDCAQDRALLQKRIRQEVDEMLVRQERELLELVEEVTVIRCSKNVIEHRTDKVTPVAATMAT